MVDLRILIVMDESKELLNIKSILESLNHEILDIVSNGQEAVRKALEISPDLILMGIDLQGDTDGVEVARQVKYLDIPFIYVTSHFDDSTLKRALATEPSGYLLKPIDSHELKLSIKMALYKKQMKISQDMYDHHFMENLEDIIYVVNLKKQKIIYISSAVRKITGWTKEIFFENPNMWMEMIIPEDRDKVISHISKIKGDDEYKKLEYRIRTKNGDIKWISELYKVIQSENGEPLQIMGHAKDITQEKESKNLLMESEKKYRNLVDNSMVGILNTNLNGDILFANEAMAKIFHYDDAEELKAINILNLYKNPNDRNLITEKLKNEGSITNYEVDTIGKNGEDIKVLMSSKLDDEIIQTMFMDITNLKQAEEKLAWSESRYKVIFESTGVLLLTFNDEGYITLFNSEWEKISGYSSKQVVNKMKWMDFVRPDYLEMMIKYHQQRLKDPDSVPEKYETVLIHKSGKQLVMYLNVNKLPGTDQWLVSAIDITELKNTQQKLGKKVQFSRALTEYALDGIITTNVNGKILYFNKSLLKIFGYSKEDLKNAQITILMPERYHKNFNDTLKKFQDTGEHRLVGRTIETSGLKKNGYEFPFEMSLTKWEVEHETFFTSIIRDITERKIGEQNRIRGEMALRESEEKYRSLVENIQDVLYRLDMEGNITMLSPSALEMSGYDSLDEMIGLNIIREFSNNPEESEKLFNIMKKEGVVTDYEIELKKKDGSTIIVSANSHIYYDESGKPLGIEGVFKDISDRKKAEEALRASEEFNRSIIASSPDCIKVLDLDGTLLLMSEGGQKLMDVDDVNSILGTNLINFYSEEFQPEARAAIASASKGNKAQFTGYCPTMKGIPKWWDVIVTPILDADGNPDKLSAVSRDITERIKGEEALRESEEKYRALMDYSSDVILLADLEGNIIESNKKAEEMFGYTKDEILQVSFTDLHPPEEILNVQKHFKRYIEGNSDVIDSLVLTKHNKKIPVSITGSLIEYGDKKVAQGIFRDITQTKIAEKAIRESEEKYKNLFEFSPDYTILVDSDGILIDVNRVAEQITGISKNKLIGKRFSELKIFPEEDLDLHGEMYMRTIKKGKIKPYKARIIDNKGKIRWVLNQSIAIKKDGKLSYVLVIGSDITEQKKAEDKFKISAERFRAVAESAIDAIVTTDDNGKIIFFNDSLMDIFGYGRVEMAGKSLTILMPDRFKKNYLNELDKFKESGKHRLIGKITSTTGLKKDGNEFPFEMSLAAWKSGKKTYFTSIIRDITERKKSEKALSDSEKRYRHLFESVPIGIVIFSLDAGQVIDVNKSMLDLAGYSREEYKKANIKEDFVDPDDPYKVYEELLEKGKVRNFETEMRRKDGSIYHALLNSESMEMNGESVFVQTIRDITYRKKAEEQTADHLKKLTILNKVIEMANNATDIDNLLKDIVYSTRDLLGYDIGGIYLTKKDSGLAELVYNENFPIKVLENFSRLNLEKMPYSKLYSEKKSLYFDIEGNPDIIKYGFKSVAIVPLYSADEVIGSLSVCSSVKSFISDLEKDILESIGMETGTVVAKMYSEEAIKDSLKEKEVLLKEIHHRVKNNLQIISSLLALQEDYVKDDPTAVNVLIESQNRVLSMAMIHEMLYQSKDLGSIDFSAYIRSLISNLSGSYGIINVNSIIDVEETFLNMETSIPMGLIVSELVSNSMKYAFPDNKPGKLTISLKKEDDIYELSIGDNGIGFPEEIDFRNIESSLGLRLVNSLVDQLDGTIELDRSQGTKFTITFNELKYKERI